MILDVDVVVVEVEVPVVGVEVIPGPPVVEDAEVVLELPVAPLSLVTVVGGVGGL